MSNQKMFGRVTMHPAYVIEQADKVLRRVVMARQGDIMMGKHLEEAEAEATALLRYAKLMFNTEDHEFAIETGPKTEALMQEIEEADEAQTYVPEPNTPPPETKQ